MRFGTLPLYLLLCACVVRTSPLPRHISYSSEAYIDCNNLELVRRMGDVAIPYSCIRGTGKPFVLTVDEVPLTAAEFVPTSGQQVGGEITLVLDESTPSRRSSGAAGNVINIREEYDVTECQDPMRCGSSNFQRDSPQVQFETVYIEPVAPKCPQGYTFEPEIGECLSVGVSSPSISEREQYFIPNSETILIRDCKEGYYFDLQTGKCLQNKKFRPSTANHFIREDVLRRCKGGYTFVPEVGICLPILEHESRPQNTEPATVSLRFSNTNCPKGSVYNPEVDLCLPVTRPRPTQQKPQAMSQVTQSEKPVEKIEKTKCKHGTVYNPEIDRCLPIDVRGPQADEPAPLVADQEYTVKESKPSPDPFRPVLLPLTAEKIGASKCKQGEVYVSEIDLCLKP